jgi:thymidylate kinase
MYIAIEGIKGVGKSTLMCKLQSYLEHQHLSFTVACPTKPVKDGSVAEWCYNNFPCLFTSDTARELLYAHRSNVVAKITDWNTPLIIGDRSIVTSYATRFWRYSNPIRQIQRVDALEPLLPAPEAIIYLKADIGCVLPRIKNRVSRKYGKEDECPEKLFQDTLAYEYIMQRKPAHRLNKTNWLEVDATQNPERVFENTIHIINELIK